MYKLSGITLIGCLFFSALIAQPRSRLVALPKVFPAPGAQLHYRIIGFTFPALNTAKSYSIRIAAGRYVTEAMFSINTILAVESDSNRIIAEVPSFGADYTWRYIYNTPKGEQKSELFYFSTLPCSTADTGNTRVRVTRKADKYKDAYIFVDCTRAMYDMNGNTVWFLPEHLGLLHGNGAVQDLKFTPQGTITYLNNMTLTEITYNGTVVNQIANRDPDRPSPNGDLHHQASRLTNGHYMALGNEVLTGTGPGITIDLNENGMPPIDYQHSVFGTVDEFDEKGELVWQYRLADYFASNAKAGGEHKFFDIHLNAFWYNEEEKGLYLGFKNINRIFKVSYPDGKLLGVLGGPYTAGQAEVRHELFSHQHAFFTRDKGLYVYNNNDLDNVPIPRIEFFKEGEGGDFSPKPAWQYQFPIPVKTTPSTSGGNVVGLPGGELFASLSMPYSDLFIVDMNKNVLWEAKTEKKDNTSQLWADLPTYRASIIATATALYDLIWAGMGK